MPVRILQDETVKEMADKIFFEFDVMQSCSITGTVFTEKDGRKHLMEKGAAVLEQVRELDKAYNFFDCGKRRKKVSAGPDTIGGPIAHKIWRWKRKISDNEIVYSIWRIQ